MGYGPVCPCEFSLILKYLIMKNLKKILLCLLFITALTACESEVTIDDPKSETTVEIESKTSDEGNSDDDRGNG